MMDSFHRAKNPDNRRTLGLHIKIHSMEENKDLSKDKEKEKKEKAEGQASIHRIVDNKELNKMATTLLLEEKEEVCRYIFYPNSLFLMVSF